jgi:hypothetical protein
LGAIAADEWGSGVFGTGEAGAGGTVTAEVLLVGELMLRSKLGAREALGRSDEFGSTIVRKLPIPGSAAGPE